MMLTSLLLLLPADPLRVMRAVRFATRFNFAPDPAILAAASSEEVSLDDFCTQCSKC
jgi:tRNA nucleotidyltransferase/poly(A) polymerase